MLPKVLQLGKFYPPDIGGIERVMQDICDGINARGLVCDVLCSSSSYNFSYEILDSRARIYRTKSFGKLASTSITPQMIFTLQKLIQAYDIIHLHLPDPMANLALFLSDIREKIIILHWHSDIIKQKHLLKLYSPLQSWLLQRAHSIIATSPKYALESAFLQPYRDKCVSIPIGIDDIAPSSLESTLPQRPAQSKKGEKRIIFALGRLAQNKGFTYLVQSAQYLPDEYEIHIGGDGALHSKLEALINEHKLSHKVKLLGRVTRDKLARHYQQCHIFVLPSIQESYGVVLLEAMSFGKPIISTKLSPSGSDYVNAHNVSGLVVPPQNPAAIAQAISEIERDYERFSRDARARFLQLFTSEKMLDSIYELYCNLYASRENLLGGGAALGYRIYAFVDFSLEFSFAKKDSASGNHSPDCLYFRAVITDKVTPTLKYKQNKQSNTANLRILEEKQTELESSVQVDCHADKSALNDNNIDSTTSATILNKSAKDFRILDEKCGLQGKSQGSYLDGNDRRDFSPLPHFSLKAESTKKAESLLKAGYAA
ncbi:glycosyltransferase [Helicobacter canis]|uniref:Glycosyltransferase n=1 Tax=Helicobacter canis TaxID=29419 RepID=A0A5M9QHL4_9HELI|nr:glycosyltransferase [Helicobacter canis]KAA8707640.1 glycosyltransferase [Helicobacter canis]